MNRAAQPEPEPTTTAPDAGRGEARTALRPPAAGTGRDAVWARRLRKPYVAVPAVVLLAVVAGLGIGALGGAATPSSSSSTTQVATVTRGPMTQTVSAEGTVAAAQTDNLSFGSAGTVTAVDVKAGDPVQAGQVLATIDSAQLQASVASAQSAVAKAQAQLADDQASGASSDRLAVDEASVASANDQLTNAQTGLNGASLVATFDGVVSQVNVTAGEQLAGSGTGGTSTTGSATGSGNSSASTGSNSSGSGGTGGGRNGGSGTNGGSSSSSSGSSSSSPSSSSSSSSTPAVQVVSKNSYVVQLPVASADVSSVKVGQTATLTVTTSTSTGGGFGGRFPGGFFPRDGAGAGAGAGAGTGFGGARGGGQGGNGQSGNNQGGTGQRGNGQAAAGTASATGTVTDVAQVATASTGVAQYPVTVAFTAGSNQIFVGSTVTGAIGTNTRNDVLQVPTRAVTTTNGGSTVTVRDNGRDETRTVKTGLTANGMTEITGGLKEGEQVVVPLPTGLRGLGGAAPSGGNTGTRGGAVAP